MRRISYSTALGNATMYAEAGAGAVFGAMDNEHTNLAQPRSN
jgi:hypothetical protein